VSPSIALTAWTTLRLVITARTVQIFVGSATSPTLEVRTLGSNDRGLVGLWTGNNSDGDFANLRITATK
jgi:hypothetical protein